MRARSFILLAALAALPFIAPSHAIEPGGWTPIEPEASALYTPAADIKKLQLTPAITERIKGLQAEAAARGWTFKIGPTGVAGRDLKDLTGELMPTAKAVRLAPQLTAQGREILKLYDLQLKDLKIKLPVLNCSAGLGKWDWRTKGKVTPPKQQQCGDCWAFASAGQMESALLMAGWSALDLSEQRILSCSNSGDCGGGRRWDALPWAIPNNVATEANYPYDGGVKTPCKSGITSGYHLLAAGWVDGSGNVTPTPTLKQAICEYGPISVSIYASPALQMYNGGVFNENNNNSGTNHAVLLIGWDDSKGAWLIKNSWGTDWGEGGYGWVQYGSNLIGKWSFWAKASAPKIVLNPAIIAAIGKLKNLTLQMR
jgi:cathepsin L